MFSARNCSVPSDGGLSDDEQKPWEELDFGLRWYTYIVDACQEFLPACTAASQVVSLVLQCTLFSYSFCEGGFSGLLIGKTRYSDKLNGGGIFAF